MVLCSVHVASGAGRKAKGRIIAIECLSLGLMP